MDEYPICRHIKTNGLQCHAPALAGNPWCYFHKRLHSRHHRFRPNDANREYFNRGRDLELCALEDRESVQLAISVVINALATNAIDTKRATALLYGLQLASANAVRLNIAPDTPEVVRTVHSSPEGLDLADPGAVIEVYTRLETLKPDNEERQSPAKRSLPGSRHRKPEPGKSNTEPTELIESRHSDPEPVEGEGSPHFARVADEARGSIDSNGAIEPNERPSEAAEPTTNPA